VVEGRRIGILSRERALGLRRRVRSVNVWLFRTLESVNLSFEASPRERRRVSRLVNG